MDKEHIKSKINGLAISVWGEELPMNMHTMWEVINIGHHRKSSGSMLSGEETWHGN